MANYPSSLNPASAPVHNNLKEYGTTLKNPPYWVPVSPGRLAFVRMFDEACSLGLKPDIDKIARGECNIAELLKEAHQQPSHKPDR